MSDNRNFYALRIAKRKFSYKWWVEEHKYFVLDEPIIYTCHGAGSGWALTEARAEEKGQRALDVYVKNRAVIKE